MFLKGLFLLLLSTNYNLRTLNTINKYGTANQIKQMYNTAQFPSTATFASLKHKQ